MRTRLFLCVAMAFTCLLIGGAITPAAAQAPGMAGKTTDQFYKNIQVLKGIPADTLIPEMRGFSTALGVRCEYCHVDPVNNQFHDEDDSKPQKAAARKMIAMVAAINKDNFAGRKAVTCITCHAGHPDPSNIATVLPTTELFPEDLKAPTMPSADEIISKYVQAIGGEQAVRKVTSRSITGTQDVLSGQFNDRHTITAQLDLYQKAPNMYVSIRHTPAFTNADGFDGNTQWAQNNAGIVVDIASLYQPNSKRNADFYSNVDMKQAYSRLTVRGVQMIDHHEAYLVVGVPASDSQTQDQLFFDVQSGLLLRKVTRISTLASNIPAETDYEDYRDTGSGVKIPFTIRTVPVTIGNALDTEAVIHILKVQDNAPVEDSKFAKPASKTP